jgi:hypothetical protein
MPMPRRDYDVLDKFIRTILQRYGDGHETLSQAHEGIMHPLTAWDEGNTQEFVPFMEINLKHWGVQ